MQADSIQDLETKIAFIERHIEEQDRIILKLRQQVETIVQELSQLKTKLQESADSSTEIPDERPPHY
jgi:uncharacterized coiled-coil protein SlyX